MTAKKRKPGVSIPEAQRHTSRVVLRLPPREAERLRELAEDEGVTVSGWVAALVDADRVAGLPERLARALQEIGEAHGEKGADPLHILAGLIVEEKRRIGRRARAG